jgi:hypothetical protein
MEPAAEQQAGSDQAKDLKNEVVGVRVTHKQKRNFMKLLDRIK